MIRVLRGFSGARRGSALTEFSFSALIIVGMLMMTIEFGLDVFLRQSSERALSAATVTFRETRDPVVAQDAARSQMLPAFRDCLEPLGIRLYNSVSTLSGDGRKAMGTPADLGAVLAIVRIECRWNRLTPIPRAVFGDRLVHRGQAMTRIK